MEGPLPPDRLPLGRLTTQALAPFVEVVVKFGVGEEEWLEDAAVDDVRYQALDISNPYQSRCRGVDEERGKIGW